MKRLTVLFLAALVVGTTAARAETNPPSALPAALSSAAERLYAAAQQKLLQIRTLLAAAGQQSSIGSGFLVSANGLAITNYHVVSQFALEPATYRLEYMAADGSRGDVALLAIDVPNDLAVVRVDKRDAPFFQFDARALTEGVPKGEHLYSMGNPLDLGFTIVEGTYNGLVERSYNERIHFTGAVNPGMSGGPAVAGDGRVVGINVAKQYGGELVSFLVPARFAATLLKRAQGGAGPLSPEKIRGEIGRQVAAWDAGLYKSVGEQGFRPVALGPYRALESAAPWFTCWARTTAGQVPKPRATVDTTSCSSDTRLFIANDLNTGFIHLTYSYVKSVDLNQFQFAGFLSQQAGSPQIAGWGKKWYTPQRCHEDFIAASPSGDRPPLRAVWCARAYREFAGLYDVSVTTLTQNSVSEALVSSLTLQGVRHEDAEALAKRFLDAVQWTK
jgi:serine protease Do